MRNKGESLKQFLIRDIVSTERTGKKIETKETQKGIDSFRDSHDDYKRSTNVPTQQMDRFVSQNSVSNTMNSMITVTNESRVTISRKGKRV